MGWAPDFYDRLKHTVSLAISILSRKRKNRFLFSQLKIVVLLNVKMSNFGEQQEFKPGASVIPATQVEISVSCRLV